MSKLVAVATVLALAAVLSSGALAAKRPNVGQICSVKKAPPAGFVCVPGVFGRYVLQKA